MSKEKKEDKDMLQEKVKVDKKALVQKAFKMGMKQNDELLRKLSKN